MCHVLSLQPRLVMHMVYLPYRLYLNMSKDDTSTITSIKFFDGVEMVLRYARTN